MTLTTLSLASIIAVLVFGQLHWTEPSYRDRKLTAWLEDLDSLDPVTWRLAEAAIRVIGTNALPVLAKHLRARDSVLKLKLIEFCENYPAVILTPAESHFDAALEACRILGSGARSLAPEIIGFLHTNSRTRAIKALTAMGEPAIKPLIKVLVCEADRAGAAVALGSIAGHPQITVAALAQHLRDRDAETRTCVAWALGQFGKDAQCAVSQLSALTNDAIFSVREQTKAALIRIAPLRDQPR